ncbi:MAG: hypothetical protein MJE68_30030 [Proteobacteria bacterium]|nr:hypothetical protein [Pseudomonadota bacterium]
MRGTLESISTAFLGIERDIYCEIPPSAVIALSLGEKWNFLGFCMYRKYTGNVDIEFPEVFG